MIDRQVSIYLQEKNYSAVRKLVGLSQISRYINQAVEEKLNREPQPNHEELQQKLARGYQAMARNQKLKAELAVWEETLEDGSTR